MPNSRFTMLRKKAPQIIAVVIIAVIAFYVLFVLLEDILINDAPLTGGPLISAIVSLMHNVIETVSNWGYSGVFGLMVLESSSLPIPSEIVLPFSGYLVSKGQLNFWLTVTIATVAAVIGSLIDYFIGLKGVEVLTKRRVLGRVMFSKDQMAFASKWFNKYGALMIFLARLVPGIRTLISFPAGAAKMPLAKFLAFTTAGCLIWNALLIYVGYYLGANWTEVADISHFILIAVIVTLTVLIVFYLARRKKGRRQVLSTNSRN